MSQPYGQQPPGNYNQGQPGQPGYGGMPPAPPEYTSGPTARPGTVTTAAVLSFVQAGLTLISSIILMIGLAAVNDLVNGSEQINGVDVDEGGLALLWVAALVAVVGAGLLIWAGVKALAGTGNQLVIIASAVQIVLCVFWLTQGAGIFPILLIVMPIIALAMVLGGPAKQFEASRRGRLA
jgi:hypothetical protein